MNVLIVLQLTEHWHHSTRNVIFCETFVFKRVKISIHYYDGNKRYDFTIGHFQNEDGIGWVVQTSGFIVS